MKLTLNVIAHELEELGTVVRGAFDFSRAYDGVRFLHEGALPSGFVYVCDPSSIVHAAGAKDIALLYVGGTDPPPAAALSIVSGLSLEAVFSALQDIFLKYEDWGRRMDASVIADGGIQELLEISSPFLRNNVVVVDPALRLLAYSKDVPCDDPVTVELIRHGYHTEENIRKFKLNKRFEVWSVQDGFIVNQTYQICKYVTVVYSFKTKRSFSLIVIMMCNVAGPEPYILDAFEMFLRRVEHYAKREYPENKPSGNTTDTFLRELIENRITSESMIAERCRFAGIPLRGLFCLFTIDLGTGQDNPTTRILADIVKKVAPAKTLLYKNAVVVLCFNCRDNTCCRNRTCARNCLKGACPAKVSTTTQRLEEVLTSHDLHGGRSASFESLSKMHLAFLQAQAAVSIGLTAPDRGAHRLQRGRVFSFDSCYLQYMLNKSVEDEENLVKGTWGCELLKRMQEYDRKHNTDNYRFLFHYLRQERRASAVADLLHMHRNNVKYRIDRIETVFGIDTNDADLRLELILAYRVLDALEA